MDLKRLKIKSGVARTSITKLTQKIDDELEEEEPCLKRLEELLEQLVEKGQILREYDKDVEAETEEEDLEDEMTTALEYMDTISVRRTRLRRALRTEDEDHRTGSRPPRMNTVKLSKLVIQKFSGEISEWQGFGALF